MLSAPRSIIPRRNVAGLTEVIKILTNPFDALKQIKNAQNELKELYEARQVPNKHTFIPLKDYFPRKQEEKILNGILEGTPNFTVLFGASSVGKTALIRHVLTNKRYHVLHFDLRIAGFTDLPSLHTSLTHQLEQFFEKIGEDEEYESFKKEALGFRVMRKELRQKHIDLGESSGKVKPSDIAELMERFQSSLSSYWNHNPKSESDEQEPQYSKRKVSEKQASGEKLTAAGKLIPVFFIDEAHKLPSLIQEDLTVKAFLDSLVVITKQDRLCHVLHATSDAFYLQWLHSKNVGHHCKVLTIGDCSKEETRTHFEQTLLPCIPAAHAKALQHNFDALFDMFGGKLAHWGDYVTDFSNAGGQLDPKMSSQFILAYAFIHLHLAHSKSSATKFERSSAIHDAGDNKMVNFNHSDLIKLFEALIKNEQLYYFDLCEELGVGVVDAMVRGRLVELRWTKTVTLEDRNSDKAQEAYKHGQEAQKPVIVAMTPIMQQAIRFVLQEMKSRKSDQRSG